MELGGMNMSVKTVLTSKKFKHGSVATAVTLVAIAAILVFNVIVGILSDRFSLKADMTPEKLYQLSDDSVNFIKNIGEPVTITVLAAQGDLENAGNKYMSQVAETLNKIANLNSQITLNYVDLNQDPTYSRKYSKESFSQGDIMVESARRYKHMALDDLFNTNYDSSTGQQTIYSSKAEAAVTGAISNVTSDVLPKAVVLSGHNEADSTGLQNLLKQNNYEIVIQNLLKDELDKTADFVIMTTPTSDYTEAELKQLDAYLDNDGKLGKNLFVTFDVTQGALPNLEQFLMEWGVKVTQNMIYETDSNSVFGFYYPNTYFMGQLADDTYGKNVTDRDLILMVPTSKALELAFEEASGGRTAKAVVTSSESGVLKPLDSDDAWKPSNTEKKATRNVVVKGERLVYDGTTPMRSTVFVSGSSLMFNTAAVQGELYSNGDLAVNLFQNTVGEQENQLNIVSKVFENTSLGSNASALVINVIGAVLIIAIPLLLIGFGIFIWLRRRHL